MKYDKPPLSVSDQARQLIARGLVCDNLDRLHHYLNHIGYYRLSAYCIPFEMQPTDNPTARSHQFMPGTTLQQVLSLYVFDRKLRLLVMEAIERIEVAVRGRWANALAQHHGSHAHMHPEHFRCPWQHTKDLSSMASALKDSGELFVVHYKKRYTTPFLPPVWVVVETLSLGALSRWFSNTADTKAKAAVAKGLGIPTVEILEGVLHVLTPVRNICAHHGRLWNRQFPMRIPHIKRLRDHIMVEDVPQDDGRIQTQPIPLLYNYLVVMAHIMRQINPGSSWRKRLADHIASASPDQQTAMGFPADWQTRHLWQHEAIP